MSAEPPRLYPRDHPHAADYDAYWSGVGEDLRDGAHYSATDDDYHSRRASDAYERSFWGQG